MSDVTVTQAIAGLESLRDLATPKASHLSRNDRTEVLTRYRKLLLGRAINQQCVQLAASGYLRTFPSSLGQEAIQLALATSRGGHDWLFPTYRDSLALIFAGIHPVEALATFAGTSHCGYSIYRHRIAPLCTPVATHTPHAVGMALAMKLRHSPGTVIITMGDGATSAGDFHEGINVAAVLNLPCVVLIQNNGYAISLPTSRQCRAGRLADKGPGYGVRASRVDGNDIFALEASLRNAISEAQNGSGPILIEAMTYRLGPHATMDAPESYREEAEVDLWREFDPVKRLQSSLTAAGLLTPESNAALVADADREVDKILAHLLDTALSSTAGKLPRHLRGASFPNTVPNGVRGGSGRSL